MAFLAVTLAVFTPQFLEHVQALATNRTIDDQNGDSLTGALPSYSPENIWTQGDQCSTCYAQPNYEQTFDHSERAFTTLNKQDWSNIFKAWHNGTIHPTDPENELSVTMTFNGEQHASALHLKFRLCTQAWGSMYIAYWITPSHTWHLQISYFLLTVR